MREKSIIKNKILEYLEFKGITKYEFYKSTGVSNGVLSQNSGMSEENTLRFISHYSEVSLDWLLKDKGDMIENKNSTSENSSLAESTADYEKINSEGKKEIEFWKMKYFEVNEKYTALLESQVNIKSNNNDKSQAS